MQCCAHHCFRVKGELRRNAVYMILACQVLVPQLFCGVVSKSRAAVTRSIGYIHIGRVFFNAEHLPSPSGLRIETCVAYLFGQVNGFL